MNLESAGVLLNVKCCDSSEVQIHDYSGFLHRQNICCKCWNCLGPFHLMCQREWMTGNFCCCLSLDLWHGTLHKQHWKLGSDNVYQIWRHPQRNTMMDDDIVGWGWDVSPKSCSKTWVAQLNNTVSTAVPTVALTETSDSLTRPRKLLPITSEGRHQLSHFQA